MKNTEHLVQALEQELADFLVHIETARNEVTISCTVEHLRTVLKTLKTKTSFLFDQLIDLCGVDYLLYGVSQWETNESSEQGFSRGVDYQPPANLPLERPRFAVVYHLLSTTLNQRLRIKVNLNEVDLIVPSVHDLFKVANWFEREAYDLYGILFSDHPDLRRILTDYGFIGYPFRKDFPLSGTVEMRYDATLEKVIYDPVRITPRVTVPKVIRDDNRYLNHEVQPQ